ncbi:MAG: cardiolipin synthase [Qingshengfaniella sp.]
MSLPYLISLISVLCLFALGVGIAFRAAATSRTAPGAVAWVISLIAAPYLAIFLWFFFGSHRFSDYYSLRRNSEALAGGLERYRHAHAPRKETGDTLFRDFEPIAQLPVVSNNDAHVLINGQDTFDAIFAACDAARHYLLVQFYTIEDDDLGRALRDRLIAAARRGVSVRLLYDQIGSYGLPAGYRDSLQAGGVIVMDPARTQGPRSRLRVNFRNHRKTVVVDGQIGFVGGLNVGDAYMGRGKRFATWRDTHLRLSGPIVSQLQLVFCEDWHWSMGETLFDQLNWHATEQPADLNALIVATGPGDVQETGSLYFFALIGAARDRLWIASPYFVPDTDILTALIHAAMRGVDVRILVPDGVDHWTPWLAAFAYFDEITAAGVQVWRYQPGFMHQKVVLVDDRIAAIGTTNLDNRSFRLNFETAALLFDQGMAEQVATMLRADFDQAERMTRTLAQQPFWIRLLAPVARLFSPLL